MALPISLVVGTARVLAAMERSWPPATPTKATVLRLVANHAIPYLVSSIGYLSASTRDAADPLADPGDGPVEPLQGERP